jgi:hypothetical protein
VLFHRHLAKTFVEVTGAGDSVTEEPNRLVAMSVNDSRFDRAKEELENACRTISRSEFGDGLCWDRADIGLKASDHWNLSHNFFDASTHTAQASCPEICFHEAPLVEAFVAVPKFPEWLANIRGGVEPDDEATAVQRRPIANEWATVLTAHQRAQVCLKLS